MKTKNAITVSAASGLSELKRAESLIRLTQSIIGTPAPAHNRTDEQGRKQGRWTEKLVDRELVEHAVFEGTYVDDKRHGNWVQQHANGNVFEGPYVDGKQHGHWVLQGADGGVQEGPYVDGEKHGHWVLRWANGDVFEGECVDGKMHGRWVLRFANSEVVETCWENGKKVNC